MAERTAARKRRGCMEGGTSRCVLARERVRPPNADPAWRESGRCIEVWSARLRPASKIVALFWSRLKSQRSAFRTYHASKYLFPSPSPPKGAPSGSLGSAHTVVVLTQKFN